MFITLKEHNKILKERTAELEAELKDARSLRLILDKLTETKKFSYLDSTGLFSIGGSYNPLENDQEITLKIRETVATLVQDELENDLIVKQKSTKVVFLDNNGAIRKTGFTKQSPDKGYSYKLIRD